MIDRRLRIVILIFLWAALVEDTLLFVMAWVAPDFWFRVFHAALPAGLDVAWLRRSAGQWVGLLAGAGDHAVAVEEGAVVAGSDSCGAIHRSVHGHLVCHLGAYVDASGLDVSASSSGAELYRHRDHVARLPTDAERCHALDVDCCRLP